MWWRVAVLAGLLVLGMGMGSWLRGCLVPPPEAQVRYVYRDRPPPPPDTVRVEVPTKITVYRKGDVRVDTVYVPVEWGRVETGVIPLKGTMPLIDIKRRSVELAYAVDGQVQVATYRLRGAKRWSVQAGAFYDPSRGVQPGAVAQLRVSRFRATGVATPHTQLVGVTIGW